MTIRVALQMDALAKLDTKSDGSLYLARAALRRGFELFYYEPQHLRMDITNNAVKVTASGHALTWREAVWHASEKEIRDLSGFDFILMRQDPPFDLAYITATHILEHLKDKVRIVNDPVGVRNAPEKILITHFPHLMPPTLITRDFDAIEQFRAEHGEIIIKPLYGHASHGIFHLRPDDDNLMTLIETLSAISSEPWITQKFLPVAETGDKRILLMNGAPVGTFNRIPAQGDIRGSPRVGGRLEFVALTTRDKEICAVLAPTLCERGLFLVGLDVIGDWATEINVTSPTGLIQADELGGLSGKNSLAEQFWDRLGV